MNIKKLLLFPILVLVILAMMTSDSFSVVIVVKDFTSTIITEPDSLGARGYRLLVRWELPLFPKDALIEYAELTLEANIPQVLTKPLFIASFPMLKLWDETNPSWVTSRDWDEDFPFLSGVRMESSGIQTLQFDITELVHDWVTGIKLNNGIIIKPPEAEGVLKAGTIDIDSKNSNMKIIIYYTSADELK